MWRVSSLRQVAVAAKVARGAARQTHSNVKQFASVDPFTLSASSPHIVENLVSGKWKRPKNLMSLPDPMNGEIFMKVADTREDELAEFVNNSKATPKSGLHNPFKNPDRYLHYGTVCAEVAAMLRKDDVQEFFIKLIQRVAPKSYVQAKAEVHVTERFFQNFSGDNVRFLAKGFQVPGDHYGQMSHGYRWPYGPVAIIAPFNFPIEIPMLQLMGALFMGNKVIIKGDSRVSVVVEQALRLLLHCGLPAKDVDFINCDGPVMHKFLMDAKPRLTQFTGSSKVGEILARDLHGKVKLEDAGWDWKVLGPDVHNFDYVAWVCDQDAYAYSGQKCSAQSALFVHTHWVQAGLLTKLETLAARRNLTDFTSGPILTVPNEKFFNHLKALLKVPGAELLFGGDVHPNCSIPACYGSWRPTAVKIPLQQLLKKEYYALCTTEVFGPFQIVVEYNSNELDEVLDALERTEAHLTAAIVSRDIQFQNYVLANTVNGTTYSGIRARTTGAPQNHWFGPAGDPRAAGIGTPEAIQMVWSCHREVIYDQGPVQAKWELPHAT